MTVVCRGVRGATTVSSDDREEILRATRELLALMIHLNGIQKEDVASAIFTTTLDLNAAFPATAARQLGWLDVPLMCSHEIDVPGSLGMCIRALVHWNTRHPKTGSSMSISGRHSRCARTKLCCCRASICRS